MKRPILYFTCAIIMYFLNISFVYSQGTEQKSSLFIVQDTTLSVVSVGGKSFLSLIPEIAPKNMHWGTYGSKIESYYGVIAYSNGAKKTNRKYQCTELVHRFITNVYGIPSRIGLGLGHAKDLAKNIAQRYKSKVGKSTSLGNYQIRLENFDNKKSTYPPVVGSIVSMHFNSKKTGYGHVAIIRAIIEKEDGSLKAILFDQHGFIHNTVNLPIQSDFILFKKDSSGNWAGQVFSWVNKSYYEVISWTNPAIIK